MDGSNPKSPKRKMNGQQAPDAAKKRKRSRGGRNRNVARGGTTPAREVMHPPRIGRHGVAFWQFVGATYEIRQLGELGALTLVLTRKGKGR